MSRLLELPEEVQLQIYQELCLHCVNSYQSDSYWHGQLRFHLPLVDNPELLALSSVCRQIRRLAQPMLFHYVSAAGASLLKLLHVLNARPDLGSHIRIYRPGYVSPEPNPAIGRAVIDGLNGLIRSEMRKGRLVQNEASLEEDELCPNPDNELAKWSRDLSMSDPHGYLPELPYGVWRWKGRGKRRWEATELQDFDAHMNILLLYKIPNVERMYCGELGATRRLPLRFDVVLPKLIQLDMWDEMSLDRVIHLAPQMRNFSGRQLELPATLKLQTLETIRLQHPSLSGPDLHNLFSMCPNLTSLSCNLNHDDTSSRGKKCSPRALSEVLMSQKGTLRELRVAFRTHFMNYRDEDFLRESAFGSLAPMKALKVLQITAYVLVYPDGFLPNVSLVSNDDGDDGFSTSGTDQNAQEEQILMREPQVNRNVLVTFLPPSIESLTLTPWANNLFNTLVYLAQNAPLDFPNLREVRVWGFDSKEQEKLESEFLNAGVALLGQPAGTDPDYLRPVDSGSHW